MLEPFGRHEVVIGPEDKDVRDVLAVLADHELAEGVDGISPSRMASALQGDPDLARTVGLTLPMVARSPVLATVPEPDQSRARQRLVELGALAARVTPKARHRWFGGPWWEEVDVQPSVDGTGTIG